MTNPQAASNHLKLSLFQHEPRVLTLSLHAELFGMYTLWATVHTCTYTVGDKEVGAIGRGLCALVGIARNDTSRESEWM